MTGNSVDDDIIQALGLALAIVGSLLERKGRIPHGEFSRCLALLADVTDESNGRQGQILSEWANLCSHVSTTRLN